MVVLINFENYSYRPPVYILMSSIYEFVSKILYHYVMEKYYCKQLTYKAVFILLQLASFIRDFLSL